MPRVSASEIGPGWGCTCLSSLRPNQYVKALGRASEVQFEYRKTEPDGTLVFHAWTDPEEKYRVTFHRTKSGGKVCKHAIACASWIVGGWLKIALVNLRREQIECQRVRTEMRAVKGVVDRLYRRFHPPSKE